MPPGMQRFRRPSEASAERVAAAKLPDFPPTRHAPPPLPQSTSRNHKRLSDAAPCPGTLVWIATKDTAANVPESPVPTTTPATRGPGSQPQSNHPIQSAPMTLLAAKNRGSTRAHSGKYHQGTCTSKSSARDLPSPATHCRTSGHEVRAIRRYASSSADRSLRSGSGRCSKSCRTKLL